MAAPALQRDRERNPDRTREEILRAAEVLFAEQGYEATSLSDVGRAAGVSRATPGYFFGSKLELYRAVLDRSFEEVRDAVRQGRARARRAARDPEVVLAGVVSDYFDFVAARPNFVRLIQREALSDAPNLQGVSLGPAAGREMVAALAEELELGRTEAGEVAQVLFSLIALTWFPLLHGHTLGRVVGLDPSAPGFLDTRKRHVTELLVAWLRARRAGEPSLPSA
ncbi:MAG: TetR/AcrR family transcriptional regulator [Gemmatimonadales bacterium]